MTYRIGRQDPTTAFILLNTPLKIAGRSTTGSHIVPVKEMGK